MIAVTLASFALLANVVSQRPGAGSTMCLMLDGSYKPCGPSTSSQCGQPRPRSSPQYHIRDESCAMNDPNGPFYDEMHGMYHLMCVKSVLCINYCVTITAAFEISIAAQSLFLVFLTSPRSLSVSKHTTTTTTPGIKTI